ncbi:MAG: hypothetical protein HW390_1865 [Candidatus Brocadiaceae bacterium]|nr:hypothetical protein [Candidatus Brocadiaceae bacterium]
MLIEYCLIPEVAVLFAHQIDHIIAEKHGGVTQADNLALSCAICNKYKGSDIASLDENEVVALFHPRRQHWSEHFQLQEAVIVPLTAHGRVTVKLLQMNCFERIAERRLLIRAELLSVIASC